MKFKETKEQMTERLASEKIVIAEQKTKNIGIVLSVGDNYAFTVTGEAFKILNIDNGYVECERVSKPTKNTNVYNFRRKIGEWHGEAFSQLEDGMEKGFIHKV